MYAPGATSRTATPAAQDEASSKDKVTHDACKSKPETKPDDREFEAKPQDRGRGDKSAKKHDPCEAPGGGSGVARGDFNADGIGDLAIGVPSENVSGEDRAGGVHVIYGSPDGLTATGNQFITQNTLNVAGVPEEGDFFGLTLAAVNINGDEYSDLAIGVPYEDTDGIENEGFVQIMVGTQFGLSAGWFYDFNTMEGGRCGCRFGAALAWGDFNNDGLGDLAMGMPLYGNRGGVIVQYGDAIGAHQIFEAPPHDTSFYGFHNFMGDSLAAGDHNGDGYDDLAVGGPSSDETKPGGPYAVYGGTEYYQVGRVFLYEGSGAGLSFDKAISQENAGGTNEGGDEFGKSLTFGDFDHDGRDDLVVGAPFENVGSGKVDAGAIFVFYHIQLIGVRMNRSFVQDQISGVASEEGDHFGRSLAAADFDGDRRDDLAIGVPFEDIGSVASAGMVHIFYGQNLHGLTGGGHQWWQDAFGVPGAVETGDTFGLSLSAWNFGKSSHADLAIGIPSEDVNGKSDAGMVIVMYGSTVGLSTPGIQTWHQDSTGILDALGIGDKFGASMY
jgi:hypothetical protein